MLLLTDDTKRQSLRTYLVQSLGKICDADSEVLSDYVVALLSNDKPLEELKLNCEEQLQDFLGDETKGFVVKVFQHLDSAEFAGKAADAGSASDNSDSEQRHKRKHHDDSRRRRSPEGDSDAEPRRGRDDDKRRRRSEDDRSSRRDSRDRRDSRSDRRDDRDRERRDDRDRRDSHRSNGGSGRVFSGGYNPQRLRDDSMGMDSDLLYNPENPGLIPRGVPAGFGVMGMMAGMGMQMGMGRRMGRGGGYGGRDRDRSPRRGGGGSDEEGDMFFGRGRGRGRGGRFAQPRVKSRGVQVERIPPELFNRTAVVSYFSKFGAIVGFRLSPPSDAHIVYNELAHAQAAIGCPAAVMGNRFIRVLWLREDDLTACPEFSAAPPALVTSAMLTEKMASLKELHTALAEGHLDNEERVALLKKIKDATREMDTLMAKRKEAAMKATEIQAKALTRAPPEKHRNLTLATGEEGKDEEGKGEAVSDQDVEVQVEVDTGADAEGEGEGEGEAAPEHATEPPSTPAAPGTVPSVDDLLSKVTNLEEKLRTPQEAAGTPAGRGRGRGRGAFRLDNRPAALKVADIHPDLRFESLLRSHFTTFGELVDLHMGEDAATAIIHFRTRAAAELASRNGRQLNRHPLTLTWHTDALPVKPPSSLARETSETSTVKTEDADDDVDDEDRRR